MAFMWPVPGYIAGLPHLEEVYLASAVIPMGWINAVGLFQHLHRQLGLCPLPQGAQHPEESEWRRDRPVPAGAVSSGVEPGEGWVQLYLDDFDCPEFVDKSIWERFVGASA